MERKTKPIILSVVILLTIFCLSGCMSSCFYDDEDVVKKFEEPYENGLASYYAGLNYRKGSARLLGASYIVDATENGEIFIALPKIAESDSGEKYEIKQFGGPTGTHAPLEYFGLGIKVKNGSAPSEKINLTIDAGALPLDTSYWVDIEIIFEETGEQIKIPVREVKFLTNAPIEYHVYFEYGYHENSNYSNEEFNMTDIYYNEPDNGYIGGTEITVQIKHPENSYQRKFIVDDEEVEPYVVYKEYILYKFTMPYKRTTFRVADISTTQE